MFTQEIALSILASLNIMLVDLLPSSMVTFLRLLLSLLAAYESGASVLLELQMFL